MVTREPSVTPRNEAAERVYAFLEVWPGPHNDDEIYRVYKGGAEHSLRKSDILAALRTERLRVVEQVREDVTVALVGHAGQTDGREVEVINAILDAVAGLTGEEPSE